MERTKYTPKRLLSLLLALIMLLGMLPTAVFAADPGKQYSTTSFINDGGARMDVELSCNNPLEVSTLPCEVTVDVHLTITVTGSDVKMVKLDAQDTGNLIKIGGINATKESLGGSYLNDAGEMVPAQAAGGTTPAAFAVNTKIIDATISGATGTLNKDRTISVPIKTTLGVTNTASIDVNKAIDQNVIFENVKLDKYIVSFAGDFKGRPVGNEMLLTSGNVTLPVLDDVEGYTFKGWLNEVTHAVQTGTVTVSQDTTFRAQWEAAQPKQYTVTFWTQKEGGKVFSTETVVEGKGTPRPAGTPEAPEAGKVFDKWCYTIEDGTDTKEEEFNFGRFINGDMTVYATWTDAPTKYTVKWDGVYTGVSNLPDTVDVVGNTQIEKPQSDPIREGYTFKYWSRAKDGQKFDSFPVAITENTTFYAVWEREQVNITWRNNNATGATWTQPATSEVDLNSTVNFTLTLDEGYELPTVTAGGALLAGALVRTDADGKRTYSYSFVANAAETEKEDGTKVREMTVEIGETKLRKVTIALPTGDGFRATFTGCTGTAQKANGRTSYTFNYGEEFQISLKADPNVTAYLLTSDDDATSHLTVTNGTTSCADRQDGHTHKATDDFQVDGYADTTYFYRVEYVMIPQGGLYVSQSVQAGQSIATAPAEPNIDGYEFKGWYKDPLCSDGQEWIFGTNTNATTVNHDNTIIYGKFEAKKYTVTYNPNVPTNAGAASGMPETPIPQKTHGTPYPLSNARPTLTGYDFKGWATSPDGPVAYQPGEQYLIDADLTLYAVWAKKTYTVTVSSGAGYSTVPAGINTVEWNDNFTFTVTVDREYAATAPTVTYTTKENTDVPLGHDTTAGANVNQPSNNSSAVWVYTIPKVQTDYTVTINVARNTIYQVSYFVAKSANADGTNAARETTAFLIQSVEHGYYASMPAVPEVSGYKFHHWERYYDENGDKVTVPNDAIFAKEIIAKTDFWAVYVPIVPTITIVNKSNICQDTTHNHLNGFGLENWAHDSTNSPVYSDTNKANIVNGEFDIAYGDSVAFDLVIDKGYDYSQLSVTANGLSMGLGDSITVNETTGVTTIHYVLNHVTGDTRISVANIQRKTITINYFANAGDDVAQVPGPQTGVKYYIEGATNDTISSFEPKRNGYTFLGWCENPAPTGEKQTETVGGKTIVTGYKDGDTVYTVYQPGDTAAFEKDTNLYAIWAAKDQKVTLKIVDEFTTSSPSTSPSADGVLEYAYEGDTIFLVGELEHAAQGTMTFYKKWRNANATAWKQIGTAAVNGGKYGALEITAEPYRQDSAKTPAASSNYRWDYKVVFTPANEEGYKECESVDDLRVYSKAISWVVTKKTEADWSWVDAQNALTVYKDSIAESNKVADGVMVAKNTYWLQIPKVIELDGGLNLKNNKDTYLTVGQHYEIIWEYQDSENHWTTYTTTTDTDWVKVTPEFSGYTFRAKVKPSASSIYTKAATYTDANALVPDVYWDYLITAPTNATVVKATKTELSIEDAENESNSIVIKNEKPFETLDAGSHKAQFEGQTITLVAKVTKTDETTAVNMGTVEFYRQVTGENNTTSWVSIGTAKLEDEGTVTGEASIEFQMPKYVAGKTPRQNKEVFKAVYVQNVTYKTSESANSEAYIKSAQLQIPVIMDADKPTAHEGKWLNDQDQAVSNGDKKTETTYNYHLGGLMAGIPHTFELKKTAYADDATADYSVVARDGRAVPADMYTMKWWTLTNANWNETTTNGTSYTAETTKVGDRYHIALTGAKNSPFKDSEAVSKDIAIGDPQGVTVTVEAIDAIKATEVDRNNGKYPDVYQLNEITLTATVEAAEAGADRKPTGYVGFYYYDDKAEAGNDPYVWLGKAKLEEIDGEMIATIKTNGLPVKPDDNTHRDVKITAVYYGDETFKPSENWGLKESSATEWEVKAAEIANKVIPDTVTVYSSVVYYCEHENKKEDGTDKGIHISVHDGVFKANEKNVVLKLSDIYTLDRELGENLLDIIAKLTPGMDYTIQWQKLNNANAFNDEDGADFTDSKHWQDIADATGVTVVLGTVEQNTAYRAVITVKDQPITKGSYTKVKQAVEGRQIYYSNILMPTDASITMSVMVNTDKNGENLEGITEGETVTANVFLSGVTGSVPNAEIEVMVEADAAKGNGKNYAKSFTKATVNGWNSIDWDTKDVEPGFYTMRITAKTNTGYATKIFERSIIVRESSYDFNIGNTTTTYNGQTQGVSVTLNGFDFKGSDINEAAKKSWTVKYYKGKVKPENLVEPSQAGTYKAVVTLPGSAYWTEHSKTVDFTIGKRSVSIADAVAQAKVYDGTDNVNIVEVILNDATTAQDSTGLPTNDIGIINGDSIYATATGTLRDANAGENEFTVSDVQLHGDDAANYVWNGAVYTEPIYVSRSQVYGETAALIPGTDVSLKLKKGAAFPADQVIKMIDQAGNKLEANKGYTLTFYYHSDTEIKQTNDLSKTGLYTVVARPNQDNYKSGVTMKFEVVNDATTYTPAAEPKPSTLITISNTAELYGHATGAVAKNANGENVKVEYQDATSAEKWSTTIPENAGRYLVRATDTNTGDVAYGIYTITKAHPEISVTPATDLTYNSMQQAGYTALSGNTGAEFVDWYVTYAGDVAIGYYATEADQKNGNVAEQAPVDAGDYVVTLHVNETQNYTAHEVSAPFTIAKKALTIRADSRKTTQYDAFPTMTATYDGLAAETNDGTPDTSLRDVQIAPEFIYNPTNGKPNYSNAALDQVGKVAVQPIDALSKNYKLSYGNGEYVKSETESNPDLEILGLPQSGEKDATANKYVAKVYYGDEVQLYPYGNYAAWANYSSELTWSVDTTGITKGEVKIDATNGLLTVGGVGTFTVTLKRGATEAGKDEQTISTTVTVTAIQKEVQIALKEVDKVYNGSEQDYEMSNITVHDELYRTLANFEGKLTTNGLKRKNIGTQIPTAKVTGAWSSQSETYGGQFTINDKEATVAPGAQSTVYGTTEKYEDEKWTVTGTVGSVAPVNNVKVASQTDVYDRLDVHDGYEILVAGTEDINYNVKYVTDQTAEDSAVTTYGGTYGGTYDGVKFTSETKSKTTAYLNDATVYGETPNALDWALAGERYSTRSGSEYHDNLADFNLPEIFVYQVYDDCIGNADCGKFDYKAANRTTTAPDTYNVDVLGAKRTAANENAHPNYTLKFTKSVTNSGATNYLLTDAQEGNKNTTTNALRPGSLGYHGGNATLEAGENFVEGSANIAQRPVKVEKDTNLGTVTLYWKLPQKDLYTALLNILKAEATSNGRGLAKGHTIKDLDLIFRIGTETVSKTSTEPMNFQQAGKKIVTLTIGDTNYVLDGNGTFEVDFETMRIRAYYYNKTFTGFNVRIQKIGANSEPAGPLTSTKGLTFKVLKEVNGVLDPNTDYATNKVLKFNSADGTYGYFTGTYDELPLLGAGELYVFQLYEYGVPLERK